MSGINSRNSTKRGGGWPRPPSGRRPMAEVGDVEPPAAEPGKPGAEGHEDDPHHPDDEGFGALRQELGTAAKRPQQRHVPCLLYTSDAADEEDSVDLGG